MRAKISETFQGDVLVTFDGGPRVGAPPLRLTRRFRLVRGLVYEVVLQSAGIGFKAVLDEVYEALAPTGCSQLAAHRLGLIDVVRANWRLKVAAERRLRRRLADRFGGE